MNQRKIDELAERVGIASFYPAADGSEIRTSPATKRHLLEGLGALDEGTAILDPASLEAEGPLPSCFLPRWLEEAPAWGITGQLYELRSGRDWGIGDFADLETLCRIAAAHGADFVGLTPLHAPFLADPERCSPFSPSNRRCLNPLHIAVDRVEGFDRAMRGRRDRGSPEADFVDYAKVTETKLAILREIWHGPGPQAAFRAYRDVAPVHLQRHALFEALSAHMVESGHRAGWRNWPEPYRDHESPEVKAFARARADDVGFHLWLQFLAEKQLAEAAKVAREAGMRMGLYLDLAVGDEPDGSATWSAPGDYVARATIGAPPDYFSTQGQDWGIAALSPLALRQSDCAPFRDLIADVAAHAGALRIDHVMALRQLFLVPEGAGASKGAHVRYPVHAMVSHLAAFSHAHEVLVIGEDLGHVPEGFREMMSEAAILSYRILYFEQAEGVFRAARDYPRRSIACLSTHDLPTFRGWWQAHDVELRLDYALIEKEGAADQRGNRERERRSLLKLLAGRKRMPAEWRAALADPAKPPSDSLVVAVHGFLAQSNALLAGVRIADLTGEDEPTNLPGTSGTYPNWRRRMNLPLEELAALPLFREVTDRMVSERPRR